MDQKPVITLKNMFYFNEKEQIYDAIFFGHHINIRNDEVNTNIEYTKIKKIKYTSKDIKIVLKDDSIIKIPCSVSDITKIKRIFKVYGDGEAKEWVGSAVINFGDLVFLMCINSTSISDFKKNVLRKVARYVYPGCCHDDLSFNLLKNIKFTVVVENNQVELKTNEDLEASLRYFSDKLVIFTHISS